MASELHRRDFLAGLGITLGGAALGVAGDVAVAGVAEAQDAAKGRIPEMPVKFGHITIQSGPGAILGLPSLKGHTLAAEEINAAGGLLGKRRIDTLTADEAAGPEATVKEVKRMKLVEKIDYFSGVIAAHNQLAVGPVVEELKLLTIMTEGCIDKLFEVEVPNPRYLFGMTNILSADGVTTALAIAKAWPDVKRIAVVNPDYAFGRWFQLHFDAAREKLLPASEIVSEVWAPFPNTIDFTSHITKTLSARPDLVVTSMWGGMYVSFYKQALRQGLFNHARLAGNINFGVVPQAIGKDHPEGALAGVHSNYHFAYAPAAHSAANRRFVAAYQKRWNEYPSYAAEAAYTGLYLFKTAVEKANREVGGWPEDDAIIKQLEGLSIEAPAGLVTVRKEDHRAYKDVKVGFSKNLPDYPFPVWDPERIMTIPVSTMTAPPTWPKPGKGHNDPSATVNWIKTTWKKAGA
ncbi:MAG TPA: ABC transporter substrate-binding protein [Methylomirabilota bacterium]|nr:ABC transporter substrate-binding protein [Methylomirabilota bacterium]